MNVGRRPLGSKFFLLKTVLGIEKESQRKMSEHKKRLNPSEILRRRSQYLDNAFINLALNNIGITSQKIRLRIQKITADIHEESGSNYPWKPGEFKAKVMRAIERENLMGAEKADAFSKQMKEIASLHDEILNGKD